MALPLLKIPIPNAKVGDSIFDYASTVRVVVDHNEVGWPFYMYRPTSTSASQRGSGPRRSPVITAELIAALYRYGTPTIQKVTGLTITQLTTVRKSCNIQPTKADRQARSAEVLAESVKVRLNVRVGDLEQKLEKLDSELEAKSIVIVRLLESLQTLQSRILKIEHQHEGRHTHTHTDDHVKPVPVPEIVEEPPAELSRQCTVGATQDLWDPTAEHEEFNPPLRQDYDPADRVYNEFGHDGAD